MCPPMHGKPHFERIFVKRNLDPKSRHCFSDVRAVLGERLRFTECYEATALGAALAKAPGATKTQV